MQSEKERVWGAYLCCHLGMVSVVHGDTCLASFLAIGEPRGAGAGAEPASLVGIFSLERAGLDVTTDL